MVKKVTADEVLRRLKDGEVVHVIDVREVNEVATGKIPGATHIPFGHLVLRKNELDKDETYVVVCQSGNRSKAACGILEALNYHVEELVGGMHNWKGELA